MHASKETTDEEEPEFPERVFMVSFYSHHPCLQKVKTGYVHVVYGHHPFFDRIIIHSLGSPGRCKSRAQLDRKEEKSFIWGLTVKYTNAHCSSSNCYVFCARMKGTRVVLTQRSPAKDDNATIH